MNAIVNGEDIINAMDLRCFGLAERTWIDKLTYRNRDYVWIAFGVILLVTSISLKHYGCWKFLGPLISFTNGLVSHHHCNVLIFVREDKNIPT